MRKLIYILLLLPILSFSQWETGLLVSRMQAGPSNLYTLANAANPDNEVDATTGTSVYENVSWASVSSSPSPQNGIYSLLMTHIGTVDQRSEGRIEITGLTIGDTYTVKFYANEVVGLNWAASLNTDSGWVSTVSTAITSPSVWTEYEMIGVADATTAEIRFIGSTSSDVGDKLGIDNIRVIL